MSAHPESFAPMLMEEPTMPILECIDLVKEYPGKKAVNGVSFDVEKGEIVGLLGPNGAGKSTTFRMACGMISPTEGRVILNGQDVTKWPMYKRSRLGMGYLPQDESVFTKLTVVQNLIAILEFMPLSSKERKHRAMSLLGQFGLDKKSHQIASTLSGGERRRLEIARCLASNPQLILLDEPFTGIDPVTINGIQDIIADLRDRGISILLTDHRERETLTICDRSNVIFAGQVLCSGDAETVLNHPDAQRIYFGSRFDASSIIEEKSSFQNNKYGNAPAPTAKAAAPKPAPAPNPVATQALVAKPAPVAVAQPAPAPATYQAPEPVATTAVLEEPKQPQAIVPPAPPKPAPNTKRLFITHPADHKNRAA